MTASRWILGGLATCLLVLPVHSGFAKPPKPGPEYKWEKHHTTPEGHYVPGRWIRKKKADAPHDKPPPPYKAAPKPGAHWTPPPYPAGQRPTVRRTYVPQTHGFQTYGPDPTSYLVAPLAGLTLYHNWWPSYSWRYRTYTYPYAYGHAPYYKPRARYRGKPVAPPRWYKPKHHAPLKVPHRKGYKNVRYKAKFDPPLKRHKGMPGKSIKNLPHKPIKGIKPGKHVVSGLKKGELDPKKKKK